MLKRSLNIFLALALTVALGCALCLTVSADQMTDAEVLERLAAAETVWPDGGVYVDNWDDGCSTCYGFVRELFRYVFGEELPTMWATYDARFKNYPERANEIAHIDHYSVVELEALLAQARPGDVFIATTGGGNHGVIVRSVAPDCSGIYVYDANWNKNSAGQPLLRTNAFWSAEDIQRSRPGAVTLYRSVNQDAVAPEYFYTEETFYSAVYEDFPAVETPAAGQPVTAGTADGIYAPGTVYSDRHVYGTAEPITIFWEAVTGATNYAVSLTASGTELFSLDMGSNTSFTSTPLPEGAYILTVRSGDGNGFSGSGNSIFITVTDSLPAMPGLPRTDKTSYSAQDSIAISWDTVYGAENYRLYIDRDGVTEYYIDSETASVRLSSLPEGTYSLIVRAMNQYGHTDSAPIQISVGGGSASTKIIYETSVPSASGETVTTTVEGVHFSRTGSYLNGQFVDVPSSVWYAENVAAAYEMGLMKGSGFSMFEPNGAMTVASAITLAARIHSIYTTGTEEFEQLSTAPWYQCYLDYAYANGIITGYMYRSDVERIATRAEFAEILAGALPPSAMSAINTVLDGSIPDVPAGTSYYNGVYTLYRAGILTGGESGSFSPDATINRAEAATIVSRMAESSARIQFSF